MNKAAYLLLSALLFPSFVFAGSYTFDVNGMNCDHCAKRLQRELGALDGIESVSVNLKTKQVILDTLEGQNLQEDQVRKTLTDSGFTLVRIAEASTEKSRQTHK